MAPLALICLQLGFRVSGSDLADGENCRRLEHAGADVLIGHAEGNLPSDGLVVRSSAIGVGNPEFDAAVSAGAVIVRRGELLSEIARGFPCSIAVGGTHGKTTVTAMLTHILKEKGIEPGFMIGGKVQGWDESGAAGNGDIFVFESDESDGTNAMVKARLALVTNIEDDHSWNFNGDNEIAANFAVFARQAERLIYLAEPGADKLFAGFVNADRINALPSWLPSSIADATPLRGYLAWDAALAVAGAVETGLDEGAAAEALKSFPGVARRMTVHQQSEALTLIEDYAHHPTEVAAALELIRRRWPDRFLVVLFQPHRYARLEKYLDQFADQLKIADKTFIAPVFAAWTESGAVDSADLAEKTGVGTRSLTGAWHEIAGELKAEAAKHPPCVIAVLGAGDINQAIPFLK